MSGDQLILIEMLLIFGLVIGWGGWELYSLRRDRRRRESPGADRQAREPRC